jgi:hypothetical protein
MLPARVMLRKHTTQEQAEIARCEVISISISDYWLIALECSSACM